MFILLTELDEDKGTESGKQDRSAGVFGWSPEVLPAYELLEGAALAREDATAENARVDTRGKGRPVYSLADALSAEEKGRSHDADYLMSG